MQPKNQIKTLIVDDHAIVRMGLNTLLKYQRDFCVVGEAEDGVAAVKLSHELDVDLIIMDLLMPGMDGAEATTRILEEKSPGILLLTSFGDSELLTKAVQAGANGAVLKGSSNDILLEALRKVSAGERYFQDEAKRTLAENLSAPTLTARQLQVLTLAAKGMTNAEVAKMLSISADAVKQHLLISYRKLGTSNRSEAISAAIRRQLIQL